MANAIELLQKDHKTVEDLFTKFEKEKDPSSKEGKEIAQRIFVELQAHAQIEEEIFYPKLQDASTKAVSLVGEAVDEHHAVEGLIDQLSAADPKSEEYAAMMKTLMSNVRHHVEKEHNKVFPLAEKELKDQLDEMGKQIQGRKKEVRQAA